MPNKRVWVWIGLDLISKLRIQSSKIKHDQTAQSSAPCNQACAVRDFGGKPSGPVVLVSFLRGFCKLNNWKSSKTTPPKKRHFVCTQYIQLYTDYSHQLAKSRHQDPTFLGGQSVLMAARLSSTDMLKSSSGALKA